MTEARGEYQIGDKRPANRVLDTICTAQWLITDEWLATIVAIADRSQSDIQAVLAARGEPLAKTESVVMRDGVAVLPVRGPIFRYANLFTQVSGATSLEALATDFGQAVANPAVKAIVLEVDSPGGMAAGISEFAAQVRAATQIKPVIAYVSDLGASAAYWIAAAASELVISDTASVGSIGVVMQAMRSVEDGTIKIVSSQSPLKHTRPDSEAGQRLYQQQVNEKAQVFIDAVATYRGVTADKVVNDFGQGFVLVGASAVAAGMADRLGTLESIIAGLSGDNRMRKFTMNITRDTIAAEHPEIAQAFRQEALAGLTAETLSAANPTLVAALRTEGAAAERARIQAVEAQMLPGYETQIAAMKFDGVTTGAEAAVAILALEKQARGAQAAAIAADAAQLGAVRQAASDAAAASAAAGHDDGALTANQRAEREWNTNASVREQFVDLATYQAYQRAVAVGAVRNVRA